MITRRARIIAQDGDFVWVEPCQLRCAACSEGRACGVAAITDLLSRRKPRIKAYNNAGGRMGEEVTIGIDERRVMVASLAVYLVPLLSMLAGAMVGQLAIDSFGLVESDAVPVGCSGCGLLSGFLWLRGFTRRRLGGRSREVLVLSSNR